jgi:hypothetical protein
MNASGKDIPEYYTHRKTREPGPREHTPAFTHNAAPGARVKWTYIGFYTQCSTELGNEKKIAKLHAHWLLHTMWHRLGNPINSYQLLHSMKNARPRLRPRVSRMRNIECTYWFKRRRVWCRMSFNKLRNNRSADCWPIHVTVTCGHSYSPDFELQWQQLQRHHPSTSTTTRQPWQPRHRQQQWRRQLNSRAGAWDGGGSSSSSIWQGPCVFFFYIRVSLY